MLRMTTTPFVLLNGTTESGEAIGYVWFSLVTTTPRPVYSLHICVAPEWKGRWLSRAVLTQLLGYLYIDMQAGTVLALHADPDLRRILKRIGFTKHGAFINILDMEHPNGILSRYLRRWRR